jgi:N-acetylmuramoyl-L-alanine amidase
MARSRSQHHQIRWSGTIRFAVILITLLIILPVMAELGRHEVAEEPPPSSRCYEPTIAGSGTLTYRTIIIDPGHGGWDPGAVAQELWESHLALQISNMLRERFRASGAIVCQTRTRDVFVSLESRAAFANNNHGSVLISIHLNSFPDPTVNYTMTMWQSRTKDIRLAEPVLDALVEELQETPTGETAPITGARLAQFDSPVLKGARMPAIIVEAVFLSHPWEAEAMQNETWRQQQIAEAIHRGIEAYFGTGR